MSERSGYQPGVPCWVDLSSTDVTLSAGFYGELFGWELAVDPRPDSGGYGRFTLGGRAVAGVAPSFGEGAPSVWNVHVAVDDVAATAAKVRAAGGGVVLEPVRVFEHGWTAAFRDLSGAFFMAWQAEEMHGAELVGEPGAFAWSELVTRDTAAAEAFYPAVFGWEAREDGRGGAERTEWRAGGRPVAGMAPMGPRTPPDVPPHWLTHFAVADLGAAVAKVGELGGSVLTERVSTSRGPAAVVADPEFAPFALLAPDRPG
ncbi:VOC family protein [Planomonospora sp. ID82291]|uniref:VOC family protein n=1 Tax=Planomonospora sp. ID82291 TaxID=2738136 RepID=UPI0018C368A9|nr:VOC family protein [Planomonospora sp. ID82291]MBG0816900.1 VOC family protein [Planomonospora sp. ID82291]